MDAEYECEMSGSCRGNFLQSAIDELEKQIKIHELNAKRWRFMWENNMNIFSTKNGTFYVVYNANLEDAEKDAETFAEKETYEEAIDDAMDRYNPSAGRKV